VLLQQYALCNKIIHNWIYLFIYSILLCIKKLHIYFSNVVMHFKSIDVVICGNRSFFSNISTSFIDVNLPFYDQFCIYERYEKENTRQWVMFLYFFTLNSKRKSKTTEFFYYCSLNLFTTYVLLSVKKLISNKWLVQIKYLIC
jgi:hypothetical protein